MFRAIAIAGALVAAVPGTAGAAEAVVRAEHASVKYVDSWTGCVEHATQHPPFAGCGLYSGQSVTLTGHAYAGNGSTPLGSAYRARLQPYDPKTNTPIGGAKSIPFNGSRTTFQFVVKPGVSTRYRILILKQGSATPKARGRLVVANVAARTVDQSTPSQRGSTFVFKGTVALVRAFGGGTFRIQRCKQSSATYCTLAANSHWGSVLYSKPFTTTGTWTARMALTGSRTVFRFLFLPRNSRNYSSSYSLTILH